MRWLHDTAKKCRNLGNSVSASNKVRVCGVCVVTETQVRSALNFTSGENYADRDRVIICLIFVCNEYFLRSCLFPQQRHWHLSVCLDTRLEAIVAA